jgi:hypothetical protein
MSLFGPSALVSLRRVPRQIFTVRPAITISLFPCFRQPLVYLEFLVELSITLTLIPLLHYLR